MDNASIKKTDTIVTDVTSTASMNFHSRKVRDILLYFLYFAYSLINNHINIDICYYFLSLCKAKRYNIKMENNEIKKARINR